MTQTNYNSVQCKGRCKKMFPLNQLSGVCSVMLVCPSPLPNALGSAAITDISIEAYSWHCAPCKADRVKCHENFRAGGGKVFYAHSPDVKKFMAIYQPLTKAFQLGLGRDKRGWQSFFEDSKAKSFDFSNGKILKLDIMKHCPEIAVASGVAEAEDDRDFEMKMRDNDEKQAQEENETESLQYEKGGIFSHLETDKMIEWAENHQVGTCLSKESYFLQHGLPLWMASKGFPYRKPRSYADQFGDVHVEPLCIP